MVYKALRWYLQVIYNCAYFFFFLYFLDVRIHIFSFYKFIIKVVGVAFITGTLVLKNEEGKPIGTEIEMFFMGAYFK